MTDKVEYYFENYRKEKDNLYAMEYFLRNFKPLSEDAVIQSMVYEKTDEERVSRTHTNTRSEMLALTFRERLEAENREFFESNLQKYLLLKVDLDFFEQAVSRLKSEYKTLATDLVLKPKTWEEVMDKHNISRSTLARKRKKVIEAIRGYFTLMGKSIVLD